MNEIKMTKIRGVCAVAIALACSACGGGGGGTASASQAQPVVKAVSIDMQGDSTMYGAITTLTGSIRANPTAPESLQTDLQSALGSSYAVAVTNDGVTSMTMCMRMSGTGLYTQTLADYLKTSTAQIVVENFGINDANAVVSANETPTQFQQCLESFVDVVRASGKTPVLEEPNPVGNVSAAAIAFNDSTLSTFIAVIDSVSQEKNVVLIPQYANIKSIQGWRGLLSDGVHPSQALYDIKAQNEATVLVPLIKASK